MNIGKALFSVLITALLFAGNAYAIVEHNEHDELFKAIEVKNGSVLKIIDCVALAYNNSPKIRRKIYELNIAESNVGIAKSQFFPVIRAGVGFYNENNSNSVYYDRHYRDLPSVGVAINQLVWDFGKTTAYINMEKFYKIAAEYEFMDSLCATLFDIKWKYYNVLRTKALREIALDNIKIQKEIIKMMEGRHPDVDNAYGVLSGNTLEFIAADEAYKNAVVDLNNAMYLSSSVQYDVSQTDTFRYSVPDNMEVWKNKYKVHQKHTFDFKREDAPEIAYKNSPDLRVLVATKDAMQENLKFIKRMYLPDLSAEVGYGLNNTNFATNNSLRVGVNLDASVNLLQLKHSIKGADSQVLLAQNEVNLFKKDLYFEIQRAFNNLDRSEDQLPYARGNVYLAQNTYNIAVDKYKQNLVDYIAVQSAKLDYINSNRGYVERLYDFNKSLIQVEMAMHYHLVDIHHKSEHATEFHSKELLEHLNNVLGCDEKHYKKQKKSKH